MDREAELTWWREQDRADLAEAIDHVPARRAEVFIRRALDLFDIANAATGGAKRVAPLGPPSRITSTAVWMEDLQQDLSPQTFFERRVLELRPDLLPDHAEYTADPTWPAVRAGVARVVTWGTSPRQLLADAARADRPA